MIDSQVVQTTSDDHDQVREVVFRVSQDIFYDPRTLDARNRMFDTDPNFRDLAIALFVLGG